MTIREATADDWPGIWPILRDVVRAGETYTVDRDIGEEGAHAMWFPPTPWRTLVAVDAGEQVAGSAKMGPNYSGPAAHVANASFIVAADRSGQGIGRALGEHVIEQARVEGYRALQFNAVVETNAAAIALWQSLGFEIVGTLPEGFLHPTQGYVGLHVMHRRL